MGLGNGAKDKDANVPRCLTVVRPLPRGLEKKPLVLNILLGRRGVGDGMRFIVLGDQIGNYGTRLPENDARVRVLDRCKTVIGFSATSLFLRRSLLKARKGGACLVRGHWG